MGRELKRVALDFNWPLDKVWGGYLNPYYKQSADCPKCGGTGSSEVARNLQDKWYGNAPFRPEDRDSTPYTPECKAVRDFAERSVSRSPEYYGIGELAIAKEATRLCNLFNSQWSHHLNDDDVKVLIESGRLWDFTRIPTNEKQKETVKKKVADGGNSWLPEDNGYIPTAKEVNDWSIGSMGHDSINCWRVVAAECERLGEATSCAFCEGEGSLWPSKEIEEKCEKWEREEPPKGDGYQIWETVSKGSPISPVFTTPEELARHMAGTKWGADRGSSYETWMKFINGPGWVPSMVSDGGDLKSGVEAVNLNR